MRIEPPKAENTGMTKQGRVSLPSIQLKDQQN